jgi:tRNA modification GTPase
LKKSPSSPSSKIPIEEEETIAAVATPFGESGIGIVRISGPLAESMVRNLFQPKKKPCEFLSHRLYYGEIIGPGEKLPIDEVLVVLMKSPKTYTREDIVEIHCHGGSLILQKVLELALKHGARMAQPGEFTKRAFLNGRIDLTQAEAVMDLIKAKTMAGLGIANQQRRGRLFGEMAGVRERLVGQLAQIEAQIDFAEEEIEAASRDQIKKDLAGVVGQLDAWIASYEEGKLFREGISCTIIGKTNVGKSSLLNVLLKEDRAIVTPTPGTTRDVIEEVLNIRGIPVRLMDTAGLRKTFDSVEQEGVKRTRERVEEADLVLLVVDGSRALDEDDREIFREVAGKKKVIALNKKDLATQVCPEELRSCVGGDPVISISALKNEGVDELTGAIYDSLIRRDRRSSPEELVVANLRHKVSLSATKESLLNAMKGLEEVISLEFIAFELRAALESLGEIGGETTSEEVLNKIFDRFCIGK